MLASGGGGDTYFMNGCSYVLSVFGRVMLQSLIFEDCVGGGGEGRLSFYCVMAGCCCLYNVPVERCRAAP